MTTSPPSGGPRPAPSRPGPRRRGTALGRFARLARAAGLATAVLAGAPARPAAAEAPRGDVARGRAVFDATWAEADGRRRALYRPRFVPAAELLASATGFGLAPAELALDGLRGRLLLTGDAPRLEAAAEALGYLDVPTPQALVEVALVESLRRCRAEHGGHGAFDRDGGDPDTFFRAFRADFEPGSWLRSELVGGAPFQGADVRGGGHDLADGLAGTVDTVLRGLAHEGAADVLARPCLVCTEGVPASVSSTLSLPVTLFFRTGVDVRFERSAERAGVSLEVVAEAVGRDAVRLRVHPWVRRLEEASAPTGPLSYPVLGVREVQTTVTVRDGQTVLVAALEGRRLVRDRDGWPALDRLPALDTLLSAHGVEDGVTDFHVLVTARVLAPGRDPVAVVPPGEPARLAARGAARR